jgi:hypothetical protein
MRCLNPINIEGRGIFPCGQCRICREMRSSMWSTRMMHERQYWDSSVFLTLTYNNRFLPIDGNLDKYELQCYIKRIRKAIEPKKIKYFACGEYGEKFGRPHYHLIIFGLGVRDYNLFLTEWQCGFIKCDIVGRAQCRYVTKYVTKAPLGRSKRECLRLSRTPEFQTCSRGLGLSWLMERAQVIGDKGIFYHGRQASLPRYYVNKLRDAGLSTQVVDDVAASRVQESTLRSDRWRAEGLSDDEISRRSKDLVSQRIEELKTRDSMYGHHDPDNQ